jgi:agmatine/peptidylarginine deiminase
MTMAHVVSQVCDGWVRRMPAEWEAHRQTWMAWPERDDTWPDAAGPARRAFTEVIAGEATYMLCT